MREDTLRCVLLARAVEDVDRAGTLLPPADRAQATREALRAAGVASSSDGVADDAGLARALGERAERLVAPLLQRYPILADVLGRSRAPAWIRYALLAAAFASGIALAALDGSRRIDILAVPFLGLVAWNLAVYVALGVAWVRRRRARPSSPRRDRWLARAFAQRLEPLVRRTTRVDVVLAKAIAAYVASWTDAGAAFMAQHLRRWLHLAAVAVALGLIAGLYLRGMVLRYEAGWESTFLGPAQVRAVLGVLYGPAAAVSGAALPQTADAVEELRWTAAGGGDAAPWIHLIAASLALYVLIPRLLLAGVATARLAHLGRAATLPGLLRPYAADVFRDGGLVRSSGITSVTPYAYEPSEASFTGLERWLAAQAKGEVRLERRSTLRYGEEDMAGPAFAVGAYRVADLHVVLLSLAATPEAENHGVVIAAARDAAHRARPPATVRVVVDEAPYAERMAREASLAPRLEERRRLWRDFVAGYGLAADVVNLGNQGTYPGK